MLQALLGRKPSQTKPAFPGGLHLLPSSKQAATAQAVVDAPIPQRLVLPLQQHIGEPAEPIVEVGQRVLAGQMIAKAKGFVSAPVHASTSGTVVLVGPQAIAHPSGLEADCIVIDTDGKHEQAPTQEILDDYRLADPSHLRNLIRQAGIVGLGGAAFPAFIKLNPGPGKVVDQLILNGAECEPYISCDDMLMRAKADEIIAGARIIQHAVQALNITIGIEDNKPQAADALRAAISDGQHDDIKVQTVPTIYPEGGEKQLIQTLTGREVPSSGLPLDIGLVCHNVGTARAVYQAITHGQPLTRRYLTMAGEGFVQQRNLDVLIGTPIEELVAFCGGYTDRAQRLIMGGPMMGFAMQSDAVPVVKSTNCVLAAPADTLSQPEDNMPCIRCGECHQACPVSLLPQQLYWHAKAKDLDKAQEFQLFDCIECGCCSQVCPSHIPLVQYYRSAKGQIWAQEKEKAKADVARRRHEFRLERQEREKEEAARKRQAKRDSLANKNKTADSIEASVARAASKASDAGNASIPSAAAAAIAAAKAKSQAKPAEQTGDNKPALSEAAQAAIAAAKARAAQAAEQTSTTEKPALSAAAQAAIAKAKAARSAKSGEADASQKADIPSAAQTAIAAAKAKAAAKQTGDTAQNVETGSTTLNPAQAAIAAAKAKAAANAANSDQTATPDKPALPNAAQAAIAAAKAKAAAKSAETANKPALPNAAQAAIAAAKAKAAAANKGENR